MSNYFQEHAKAVKAAIEISRKYDGKQMPAQEAEKFNSYANQASGLLQLSRLQNQNANGEVSTVPGVKAVFRSEDSANRMEAFRKYVETGEGIEQFLHKEGDISVGGAFVPVDFDNAVSMAMPAFSPIRKLVNVVNSKSLHYEIARIKGDSDTAPSDFVTSWKGEGMDISDTGAAITAQSTPTTQLLRITAKLLTADPVVVTREMLADGAAFENALTGIFAAHFAQALEYAYLLGDGITRPRGILSYPSTTITQKTIGSGSTLTYSGLVDLYTCLPSQYLDGAVFVMNRTTYGSYLKLAGSTNDHPLFAAGIARQEFFGKPIILSDYLDNPGSSKLPVIFGNFKYYRAVDRQDMQVLRAVERYLPHVALIPFGRFGGDVEVFNAFRVGACS